MSERAHSSDTPVPDDGPSPLETLEAARNRYEQAQRRIEEEGGEAVEDAADAYRSATDLLESYVDRATGTGRENFRAYVELEGKFATLVENLSDDLEGREAFEDALDAIDKRRLSESDFEKAHAALEPAAQYDELLEEREDARAQLAEARKAAARRLRKIDDELAERERLLELANADLDAPVERLRKPIEAYNEAIREAVIEYRREVSAREVFALLERSQWYPFVGYERPPADLREYVETSSDGEYTIPELLEYADYSRSKLDHYVEDADVLKRRVATQRTFLDNVDAEPLTLEWPPGPAGELRQRIREYRPFVERVGSDETVERLRDVRMLTYDDAYDRLQTAAQAVAQLTPEERERLTDGRVADELEALREERDRLEEALEVDDPV
ncbi:DUF7118 family protein [Natronobacterium gregoryi]|uniref:Uncharacterized protein n=2 Tax=Natronobacterium gregoryi TaxID=44930 RepID=L0AHG8_NATGS|nr:hypothetical protein [Natronobacterium gregoryi]AFZ72889.1 hypothetical protein Natgr_1691 [Natronobacterium gregoryi SP2]ELY69685.1 hypothetical protein C490_07436 [Natronobacterium gregoryi SP2]PLK21883.1 hypothetical protein CYV19_01945 [Natronobacterium gregoryi SP2]SFI66583.1 hypothetical protein SAMN05443661_10357 [Natronobacterium gregoryi]